MTVEITWKHPALWLPYIFAEVMTVFLWRLRGMAEESIFNWQSVHRNRALMVYIPIGFGTEFVIVCLFAVALTLMAKMVGTILDGQKPKLFIAIREIAPLTTRILLFSIKFLLAFVLFLLAGAGMLIALMRVMHHSELPTLPIFVVPIVLVLTGCTAWLLTPATIRLLQVSQTQSVSSESWKRGAISAILAVAAAAALGYVVLGLESRMLFTSQFERACVFVANKAVAHCPVLLFFVALSLLALRGEEGLESADEL